MNHDELRDSIPALALHALPRGEQELVETHVSRCAGCSFEYGQYQEVAALLAHLVPAVSPPPTLWHRIERGLAEDRPPAPATASAGSVSLVAAPDGSIPTGRESRGPTSGRRRPGTARIRAERPGRFSQRIVALAAVAVVVIGGAGIALLQRPGQQQQPGRPAGETYEAIARQPHTVVPLRATTLARGASGEVLVAPDGKVAVAIHDLPAPGSGTYTMWLADGQTRSLGDFHPDASGEVRMATAGTVGHSPKLIVTLESRRGNTSPTGPSILSA